MMCVGRFDFPPKLRPNVSSARSGTAEAVPFQIAFMKPVLTSELYRAAKAEIKAGLQNALITDVFSPFRRQQL